MDHSFLSLSNSRYGSNDFFPLVPFKYNFVGFVPRCDLTNFVLAWRTIERDANPVATVRRGGSITGRME
jgi:hypothetical protein